MIGDQTVGPIRAAMSSPVGRWLGEVSYGLYLWHPLVLTLVGRWVARGSLSNATPVRLVIVVVVSLAVAHVSWTAIERPILRWANRR